MSLDTLFDTTFDATLTRPFLCLLASVRHTFRLSPLFFFLSIQVFFSIISQFSSHMYLARSCSLSPRLLEPVDKERPKEMDLQSRDQTLLMSQSAIRTMPFRPNFRLRGKLQVVAR